MNQTTIVQPKKKATEISSAGGTMKRTVQPR